MSVDVHGSLVRRRVVGWHATPLGERRVYRLSYATAKRAGDHTVAIQLTGDHPVLTRRGYVSVEALADTDEIAVGQGLSELAHDVACGTLLGDGSLSGSSSHLSFSHSRRQAEYAAFKADLLAELSPRTSHHVVSAVVGGPQRYESVHVRTLAHRSLRVLRKSFYGERKRVPRWLEEELNERMVAIWFMDDGYTRIRPTRRPLAEIATNGFTATDIEILIRGLAKLGLPAKAARGRIVFDVPTTRTLAQRIAPYVPPAMRYKLHPEVAEQVPYDPTRFERGRVRTVYDRVQVEDITDRSRSDTTFFCIDVEETHNFVTAGGVVHNCRPPGNRDPQADEIESCEPHLFKQLELIQPKLVATLGNFATKLLTGKPTGITRVHGQEQWTAVGGNRVLLYPLYHPAAALYTPAMLQVLEEDFRRIPELLGTSETPKPTLTLAAETHPAVQLDLF